MNTLKRICHLGPLTTLVIFFLQIFIFLTVINMSAWETPFCWLGMIKVITGATFYCNSKWWPPADSIGGALNSLLFFALSSMAIINFFTALYDGPGFLPRKWQPPDNNTRYLQYCEICLGYKAPRSHHCRKCRRCVLKMDHHCPWINGCVGYQNHGHFILFIFFSVCGCIHSIIVVSCTLKDALRRGWYYHQVYNIGPPNGIYLGVSGILLSVFALGMAIGVVFSVGLLLYIQLRSVVRNRTAVEEWILEKAAHRRFVAHLRGERVEPFVYPYNLGVWENITEVLNWRMRPKGDGITWKIRKHPKCDQYTLTREQMEQKAQKRLRSRIYCVVKKYSGCWVPISHGILVLLHPPLTDEDRLPLVIGECLRVTRSRRYWLFGEKLHSHTPCGKTKGWFPRNCVTEMTGGVVNVAGGAGDVTGGARDAKDDAENVPDAAEDLNGNVEDVTDTEGKKDR